MIQRGVFRVLGRSSMEEILGELAEEVVERAATGIRLRAFLRVFKSFGQQFPLIFLL